MKNDKSFLILYKNKGKFYNAYEMDAYILNLLFDYKVIDNRKTGFPENVLKRIIDKNDNPAKSNVIAQDFHPYRFQIRQFQETDKFNAEKFFC